jgi:putative ABC transport system permease protein
MERREVKSPMTRPTELWMLALRSVRRNKRRSVLSGAMIATGVVAVIFTHAYIAGLQNLIVDSAIQIRHGALQVQRAGYQASQDLAPLDLDLPESELEAAIAAVPGVAAVSPRVRFVGLVTHGESSTVFSGLGVDPDRDRRVCPRGPSSQASVGDAGKILHLSAGRGLRGDRDEVVLGAGLAEGLKARLGDTVTLLVQTQSGSMDAVDLEVVGIYLYDEPTENKHSLTLPLVTAQRVLHMKGRATGLAIAVHDRGAIAATAVALRAHLSTVVPATEVLTWEDLSPYYRDVMHLQDRVLVVLMVVVFALLLAGVANTMLMSVFERTREIGTLLCVGFRRRRIVALFLCEGLTLGLVAGLVGLALGAGLVAYVHHVGLPFDIPAVGTILNRPTFDRGNAIMALGAAAATAVLAGLYPAYRASRLRPADALRAV